jgi:hypothetical protein
MTPALRIVAAALLLAGLAAFVVACEDGGGDGSGAPGPDDGNLFGNPSFEDGRDPWFSLKPPDFLLSDDVHHSGGHSAHLVIDGTAQYEEDGHKIIYLVQEVAPDEFPEKISGYYRVENWVKGTEKQYLQFVVIAFGVDNLSSDFENHQIRYLLAGLDEPPFAIANAQFVFLTREDPVQGEWVYFERNLRDDFAELWGEVPQGFENMRLLFEVRYDDKLAGEGPLSADVYYDDLYMGTPPPP